MLNLNLHNYCKCAVVLAMLIVAPASYADVNADEFVRTLSSSLIEQLEKNSSKLSGNSDLAYQIAVQIIKPRVDLTGMSRSVLGRKVWTKMTTSQKDDFTSTFTDLIMKTYSRSLTGYDDDQIKVLPMGQRYEGKKRVVIKSVLTRGRGQEITLKYRMMSKSTGWLIYDVSVEGISLLQNFRTQFSAELARGTVDELIVKMKKN